MGPLITSAWENGCLVFRDSGRRVVDVMAPRKMILTPQAGKTTPTTELLAGQWYVDAVNSGTVAPGKVVTITTGAEDDDDVDFSSAIGWNAAKGLTLEAKVRNTDVDPSAFNIGFSDAQGEAADKIAITYAVATATTNATDAALFFSDSDATSKVFRAMTVSNDTDSVILTSTTAPADANYNTFKLDIDLDGKATFYLDESLLGVSATAVRSAVDLCAYVGYITREAEANLLLIADLAVWQWTA